MNNLTIIVPEGIRVLSKAEMDERSEMWRRQKMEPVARHLRSLLTMYSGGHRIVLARQEEYEAVKELCIKLLGYVPEHEELC